MYFTFIACLNLAARFSLGMSHLYLDFIKSTVEKVDPHALVVLSAHKDFPKFKSKLGKIKNSVLHARQPHF